MANKFLKNNLEKMNENIYLFIFINIVFFIVLFLANSFTPLMGDDLVYMNVLDSSTLIRISSINDALSNTIYLYRIWSGRILVNFLNFGFIYLTKTYSIFLIV